MNHPVEGIKIFRAPFLKNLCLLNISTSKPKKMNFNLSIIITALIGMLMMTSCKKTARETSSLTNQDMNMRKAITGPKLTQITIMGQPFADFTYTRQGRIASAKMNGVTTTYTYTANTLTITSRRDATNETVAALKGKLNTKGLLITLEGYETFAGITNNRQSTFTYDDQDQLVRMETLVKDGDAMKTGVVKYTWQDGNIMSQTYTYDNKLVSTTLYTYDMSKLNKLGLSDMFLGHWVDDFLGKRPNNHVTKNIVQTNVSQQILLFSWQLNADGYPKTSTLDAPDDNLPSVTFEYFINK